MMVGETKLFLGNLLNRNRHKEQLTMQEQQIGEEVAGLNSSFEAITRQLTIAEEQQQITKSLIEKGLAKRSDAYAVDSQVASLLGEQGELLASTARARSRIGEVQLEKLALDETARNDAQRELRVVDSNIAELNERRDAVNDRLLRTEIRSPIDGIINELSVTTLGGVVTPAETLATIVPADADLKVEVRLRTVDVDQISLGQPARLRFSAFNQRTTPEVPGEIIRVAAAAQYDDATGEAFYIADVSFEAGKDLISGLELRPGMPVEVFVETAHMSPATYLVKPFTDQLNRAFREE
jgi:HlyD family secretion protein